MSLSTKILLVIGAMLTAGVLGFVVYKQIEMSNRQEAIQNNLIEQKQLIDGIVRSQSQWSTKADMEKFITDNGVNLKAIKADLDKLNGEIVAVNAIVSISRGQNSTNIPSTGIGPVNPNPNIPTCPSGEPCKNADPFGYLSNQQNLTINEDFGTLKVPFGSIGFSAWQDKPWSIDIKPREYNVTSVIATDENQKQIVYNKFTVKIDSKNYDLPITSAKTVQVFPESKFNWFNPRLYIGVDGGVGLNPIKGEFTPNINVGIMSYGKYKNQPDLSILGLGAGFGTISKRPQLVITPITYNIGRHIPLMNNTYIGPSLHVGTDGNVSVMGGLRVGL